MGWWKVNGTRTIVGDEPLDTLTAAVAEVVSQYQATHGRKPTAAEWEALLLAALGGEEPDARVSDEGTVVKVQVELS